MTAIVTQSYRYGFRYSGKRAGGRARFFKDEAHARLRTEERRYLAQADWDDVIQTRPITDWDTD